MKTRFLLAAAILCGCLCTSMAEAQVRTQKPWVGHLSAGVTAGTDGFGLNIATPLGDYFQIRAGYSVTPTVTVPFVKHVEMREPWKINQEVKVNGSYGTSGPTLFVDLFPNPRHSHFHITAGLIATNGKKAYGAYTPSPLPVGSENYATTGFPVGDDLVTTDPDGYAEGFIDVVTAKPYVGIGAGRECRKDRRLSFSVDIGVMWHGTPRAYSYDWSSYAADGTVREVEVNSSDLNGLDVGLLDFTREGLIDVFKKVKVVPVVRFGLYYGIF